MFEGGDSVRVYAGFDESGIVCNSNLNHARSIADSEPYYPKIDSNYNCGSSNYVPPLQPSNKELFDT
jgi:hypothetical protein